MRELNSTSKHLPGLNGLRALAVIAVITSHAFFSRSDIYLLKFFSGGWGVTLFFVISGFLIATLLLREAEKYGRIDVRAFYMRRTIRIVPPAYFFLLVVFFLTVLGIITVSPASLLSALLFTKNISIPGIPHEWHLGHFWSLAVEEQYYLILPLIFFVARKQLPILCGIMITISLTATYLHFHVLGGSFHLKMVNDLVLHMVPLLIGTLFALWNHHEPDVKRRISSPVVLICMCVSILLLSSENTFLPKLLKPLFSSTFAGVAILGVINISSGAIGWLLNNPASDFLGRISYSLYLWQQLFTNESILKITAPEGYILLINLIVLLIIAVGSYYFIEKPLFGVRERLRRQSSISTHLPAPHERRGAN